MKRIIVGVATACLSMAAWAQQPSTQQQNLPNQPSQQPQQMGNQQGTTPMGNQQGSQMGAPTGQKTAQVISVTATVDKVDAQKRELFIKGPDGNPVMLQVPENVQNLDNLKPGDQVQLDYYQSVALSLQKKAGPMLSEGTFSAKPASGNMPGGMMGQQIDATAKVKKVDLDKNTVTIMGPQGKMDTITVKDPQLKQELAKVKPGDAINVTYTEAMAITASPKKGGNP